MAGRLGAAGPSPPHRLPRNVLAFASRGLLTFSRDVPYQSMLKILLAEKVQQSFGARKRKGKAS